MTNMCQQLVLHFYVIKNATKQKKTQNRTMMFMWVVGSGIALTHAHHPIHISISITFNVLSANWRIKRFREDCGCSRAGLVLWRNKATRRQCLSFMQAVNTDEHKKSNGPPHSDYGTETYLYLFVVGLSHHKISNLTN